MNTKLTPAAVLEIRNSPLGAKELAVRYGVSLNTIYNVLKGKTYSHIKGK